MQCSPGKLCPLMLQENLVFKKLWCHLLDNERPTALAEVNLTFH